MAQSNSTANRRLIQLKDLLTNQKTAMSPPWDPNCTIFPTRRHLPQLPNAPQGAAWVWGEDDFLGRLNLLTPTRVAAAKSEIKTGEIVPVNLPLDEPRNPAFGREQFKHEIKPLVEGSAYDDLYTLNTQSGTQWDGLRHFAHPPSGMFYNRTTGKDIQGSDANDKCGMHHWAQHGIAGRGVLLDFWGYADKKGLHYDLYSHYGITYDQLYACGKDQGIDIRPASQGGDIKVGDMIFIRMGWKAAYDAMSPSQREEMGNRPHSLDADSATIFAGLAQEEKMVDWLHDTYAAAVAGDTPSLEVWPTRVGWYLHEYILPLWGMPLGEMLDLEGLARTARAKGRWFFFFTSAPANVRGGVASHVNGLAIF